MRLLAADHGPPLLPFSVAGAVAMCRGRAAAGAVLLAAVLIAASSPTSAAASPCATSAEFSRTYEFPESSAPKLTVFGFRADVKYVYGDADTLPALKIIAASSNPDVTLSDDGQITVRESDSCPATGVFSSTSAASRSAPTGVVVALLSSLAMIKHPKAVPLGLLALIAAASIGAHAQESCTPSVEIEIHLPAGAKTSASYGETDHYLPANASTVRWGYFDLDAPPQVTMKSGETITAEVVTHHSGHDYAKMIRGDPAVEGIFYWEKGTTLMEKPVVKPPGSGVHLITGPIAVEGAEPGDVLQVDILELEPRPNADGKTYGTNSQKFAGYQFRAGKVDGTPYTRTGGHEAITVFEFVKTPSGKMAWGKPLYMYAFPNLTDAAGEARTFDGMPCVVIPHETNYGADLVDMDGSPVTYPAGFDGTTITDEGGIKYLDVDLDWKVPLRPHLGTMGVMPANTDNYLNGGAANGGGANTIPPSKFGGNVDDWRIGKGGRMYYTVEVPGAKLVVGDTHAAQGDSELAGTAMETSMTAKLKVTLHKADSLPAIVSNLNFPLLETDEQYVVHGFAFADYLEELEVPSSIFAEGASLDMAFEDCFNKTRLFLMRGFNLTEEESIAMMSTGVDFGVTQVVDGNWGVHADIDKWMFEAPGAYTPYSYDVSTNGAKRRSLLAEDSRRALLQAAGIAPEAAPQAAATLFDRVTKHACASCGPATHGRAILGEKMLDAKVKFVEGWQQAQEVPEHLRRLLEQGAHAKLAEGAGLRMSHAIGRTKRRSAMAP